MRVNITGRDGKFLGWFSPESAECLVSNDLYRLYRTAAAKWVHHENGEYRYVDDDCARSMMESSGLDDIDTIMANEKKIGRPVVGLPVQVRLKQSTIASLNALTDRLGVSRADWLRKVIEAAIEKGDA